MQPPLKMAYQETWLVDEATKMGVHYILQNLSYPGTCVVNPFVTVNLAFSNINLHILHWNLPQFTVSASPPTSILEI